MDQCKLLGHLLAGWLTHGGVMILGISDFNADFFREIDPIDGR